MHDLPTCWHVRRDAPADGVTNMAVDAALLATVAPARGTWRWYGWEVPTLSFGRHEHTRGRFDAASCAAAGLAVVRRPTGGRALLHAREVTYSVTMPWPAHRSWRDAYGAINAVLLAILARVGIAATLAPARSERADGASGLVRGDRTDTIALAAGGPCFTAPAEGEVMVAGQKLVASAVWRQGDAYLQHGSLLVHDDQARLLDAALAPLPPPRPAGTLASLVPTLDTPARAVAALDAALPAALASLLGEVTCVDAERTAALDAACDTARRSLDAPEWLWRR